LTVDGTATITTDGNTTQLTLKSTDADASVGPRLDLTRDSASPAADDTIGVRRFLGNDSAGGSFSYALIQSFIEDPTDGSEDGKLVIETRLAGSNRERISMDATELVINESSRDLDFRVESDNLTHALFVQGSDGDVGIGTTPSTKLHLGGTAPGDSIIRQDSTASGTNWEIGEREAGKWQIFEDDSDSIVATFTSSGQILQGITTIPTGVQSSRQLISSSATGAEIIAYREDNALAVNDFCGAFLIGNDDNSGTEDHFIGMWGEAATVSGKMNLKFAAGRDTYETGGSHMMITSDGNLLVGKTVTTIGTSGFQVATDGSTYSSIASSNTYHVYNTTSPAYTFYVNVNGGIYNYSDNNSNLSDEREKKNIENLESQWDSLKQWSLKKFHRNADADSDTKKLGVIAQEVEAHNPEVISEFNVNENTTRMAVKEQQMMWMAIKALQEAQTRIETLEAKVQTLENN
jgi:hypothetical protein